MLALFRDLTNKISLRRIFSPYVVYDVARMYYSYLFACSSSGRSGEFTIPEYFRQIRYDRVELP